MVKPEDIPQRVWDEAVEAVGSPDVYVGRLSALVMYERVARAILATEKRERGRIRSLVADGWTIAAPEDVIAALEAMRELLLEAINGEGGAK